MKALSISASNYKRSIQNGQQTSTNKGKNKFFVNRKNVSRILPDKRSKIFHWELFLPGLDYTPP